MKEDEILDEKNYFFGIFISWKRGIESVPILSKSNNTQHCVNLEPINFKRKEPNSSKLDNNKLDNIKNF